MSVSDIWIPLALTLKLAAVSTLLLLLLCTPLAWWLAHTRTRIRPVIEALVSLPIVLPPSVLGFYLLVCLAPSGPVGKVSQALGGPALVFSFTGLVIGSLIYSLPFVAQPLQNAFSAIKSEQLEAAATLGSSPLDRFFSIAIPQAKQGIVTAAVLGFAHTLGEFGVVLMIGGSIPGETRTLSIAIYESVEMLEYGQAHILAGVALAISFVLLVLIYSLNRASSPFKR
ncbi:molybdate ABC transporter permease subunit [Pelagicoccus sp. SDUM812002]|uniref:molybdate ABC transporter permease subunit n=1 Tax=Pelagicoccus sp. SDUM812002 TaxID=3041266 RepID=UPI0028107F73|nr:molybdate ABC transporter permease subunit [Pelagicoccus sp. SDUM812002]MDQ8186056.1 molybdate ABC transporter permease subunit [Pelagicoccus sp. SDUM812002]